MCLGGGELGGGGFAVRFVLCAVVLDFVCGCVISEVSIVWCVVRRAFFGRAEEERVVWIFRFMVRLLLLIC